MVGVSTSLLGPRTARGSRRPGPPAVHCPALHSRPDAWPGRFRFPPSSLRCPGGQRLGTGIVPAGRPDGPWSPAALPGQPPPAPPAARPPGVLHHNWGKLPASPPRRGRPSAPPGHRPQQHPQGGAQRPARKQELLQGHFIWELQPRWSARRTFDKASLSPRAWSARRQRPGAPPRPPPPASTGVRAARPGREDAAPLGLQPLGGPWPGPSSGLPRRAAAVGSPASPAGGPGWAGRPRCSRGGRWG